MENITRKESKQLREHYRRLEKQIIFLWIFFGIMVLGMTIGLVRLYHKKHLATPLDTSAIVDQEMHFKIDKIDELPEGYDDISSYIEDNYLRYLNKAYILIGTYPECEYIKISSKVTRNEFNWSEDFYENSEGLYYSYFKNGEDLGRVGIDVSEFQKTIEWDKVKEAGVSVAMIRVGYRGYGTGEIHADSLAETNMSGAIEAGLDTGVYFFSAAVNREEGIEEAEYVLNMIKGFNISQPVVIDTEYIFEDDSARTNNISVEDRTAAVVGFCETVEAAGYTPMIYASRDQFIRYLDIDSVGKWEFWLAAYDTPVFPYHTEGYQYSPYGYVNGIPTQVDLDVWMR